MRRGAIVCQPQYTRRSRRRNKARFLGHLQVNVGIHWTLMRISGKMMPAVAASCSLSLETADQPCELHQNVHTNALMETQLLILRSNGLQ